MGYIEKAPAEMQGNVFSMVGSDWMLVTAQNGEKYNTMTASWGGMGILWGKPVAFVFIRPQRYTYTFLENTDRFTLSFFGGMRLHCAVRSAAGIQIKLRRRDLLLFPPMTDTLPLKKHL